MKTDLNNANIRCPLFKNHRNVIRSKKNNLNRSARPIEKSIFAEEIVLETHRMRDCNAYDQLGMDCNTCKTIARIQEKIASGQIDVRKTA